MPLGDTDAGTLGQEKLSKTTNDITDKLAKTPFVPLDPATSAQPTDIVMDPIRLRAFEPFRRFDKLKRRYLPSKDVIKHGQTWRDAIVSGDSSAPFRRYAGCIGLTAIVDNLLEDTSDDDDIDGLVDILGQLAGVETIDAGKLAIPTKREDHDGSDIQYDGQAFFETLKASFASSAGENADSAYESDICGRAARALSAHHVPIIPATRHRGDNHTDEVTHLVRAKTSNPDAGQAQRAARIVFRQKPSASKRSDLPSPPDGIPVFLAPHDDLLATNARTWGTAELGGEVGVYRRVGAELGRLSTGVDGADKAQGEWTTCVGYLLTLYKRVATSTKGGTWPEGITPKPHEHRGFRDVQTMLTGVRLSNVPDKLDDFRQRQYLAAVALPTQSGTFEPAGRIVFGRAWARRFDAAAQTFECRDDDQPDDAVRPFRTDDAPAANYRRWARVIDLIEDFRHATDADVSRLAKPDDSRWNELIEEAGMADASSPQDWLCHFLVHLGVQVGPEIQWGWMCPSQPRAHRRVSALSFGETKHLSRNNGTPGDAATFDVCADELGQYTDVAWRSEHHPAFTAGHSDACGTDRLENGANSWCADTSKNLTIPSWYRFARLPKKARGDASAAFRQAIHLMWPELDAYVLHTGWLCSANGHQAKKPHRPIPSMALVQLREAPIWSGRRSEKNHPPTPNGRPARQFVYRAPGEKLSSGAADRGIASIDLGESSDESSPRRDFPSNPRDIANALGAIALKERSPSQAARRLSDLSNTRPPNRDNNGDLFSDKKTKKVVFALMRRLISGDEIDKRVHDKNKENQWLRRDLEHVELALPINRGGVVSLQSVDELADGESAPKLYKKRLPHYARTLLEAPGATGTGATGTGFVELPRHAAAALGAVLDDPGFGVRVTADLPALGKAGGKDIADEYPGFMAGLKETLTDRRDLLIAACHRANVDGADDNADAAATIDEVIDAGIAIVDESSPTGRTSAVWNPDEGDGHMANRIALYKDPIDKNSEDSVNLAFLVADGLAQLLKEDHPTKLSERLKNVLVMPRSNLEKQYENELEQVQGRHITRLKSTRKRLQELLEAFDETLQGDLRDNFDDEWAQKAVDKFKDYEGSDQTVQADGGQPLGVSEAQRWADACRLCLPANLIPTFIQAAVSKDVQKRQDALKNLAASGRNKNKVQHAFGELRDNQNWAGRLSSNTLESAKDSLRLAEFWSTIGDPENNESPRDTRHKAASDALHMTISEKIGPFTRLAEDLPIDIDADEPAPIYLFEVDDARLTKALRAFNRHEAQILLDDQARDMYLDGSGKSLVDVVDEALEDAKLHQTLEEFLTPIIYGPSTAAYQRQNSFISLLDDALHRLRGSISAF